MDAVDNNRQKNRKTAILGIFAKQPVAGLCKTRLSPPLTLQQAAEFYQCSLQETVQRLRGGDNYDLAICYAGERCWFEQTFPGAELIAQQGDDLGARMATALAGFLRQGYRQAVLVGSDSPDLPLAIIDQAFAALQNSDVVLAPASDGGYVLIGESQHYPQLFSDIAWSTSQVLGETERRIAQQSISAVRLDCWEDLDDLASLQRFLQRSPHAMTAAYLRKHLASQFSSADKM